MFRHFSAFTPTVWLVIVATMVSRFTFFMIWPYMAVILHDSHALSALEIGAFLTSAAIVGNLIGFYVGYLSDIFGRRKVILGGLVISVIALTTLGLTESLLITLFAMMLQSLARNAVENPAKALITDLIDDREAKDFALHVRYFALNIGAAFGPLVGVTWGLTGKQTTFLFVAATMAAYFLAALVVFYRDTPKKRAAEAKPFSFGSVLATLRRDHGFMVFVLSMFLGLIAYSQLEAGIVQYLQLEGHPNVIGFYPKVTLVNGLTVLALQFPLLALTKSIAPMARCTIGIGLMALSFAILALVPVTSDLVILGAVFVLTVGEVILFPTLQIIIDRMAPKGMKGSYFGAAALSGFGFAVGPLVGGALLDLGGGSALWWGMAVLAVLVSALYRLAGRLSRV